MPITAWICKGCNNRVVPLDHFATTRCGETVCHPDYAAAVLADRVSQPVGAVRVTNGLGCPRRAAIEASEDYAADPLDFMPMMGGTAWDRMLSAHAGAMGQVEVSGVVDGIPIVGHIDRLTDDAIEDHKRVGFLPKDKSPDPEYVAQTSMYGHFTGRKIGRLWYATHFDMVPMQFDLWPLERTLEFRPYGSADYTTLDLYRQTASVLTGKAKWQELPLAGQGMRFKSGKSPCDYCSVREICCTASMGSPF